MKRLLAMSLLCLSGWASVSAQDAEAEKREVKEANIVFEETTMDVGTFPADDPVRKTTFTFTNEGNAPLVIHQAIASCGCTVPSYPRMPVKPGEKGKIEVTYNGSGKNPGRFKKSITVRTNSRKPMARIYITGVMEQAQKK